MKLLNLFFSLFALLLIGCASQTESSSFSLPYEKYSLDNGLEVVLSQDTSDPIVTVAIKYHVGSSREKVGKTGFAHFFEHMLFQRSENLPRNAFFTKIDELGGSFNGFTSQEGTCYFETVPRNALEKILWMESDRMGFFINTVTEGGLRREIDVVSNEKRQGENRPYGHLNSLILSNFYPQGHPYSWTVIGEIPDLRSATVEDVKEFYSEFYVPANATLVISGDFDVEQTKALVQKYFGEIAKGPAPEPLPVTPVTLTQDKKIVYSDSYAQTPLLAMVYSTVETNNKDRYAIELFNELLVGDESSPLYKRLVKEKALAPEVSGYNNSQEIAGNAMIYATALEGVSLNDLYNQIDSVIAEFGDKGVDEQALQKYKNKIETNIYNQIVSTQGKAINLAVSNTFSDRPDQIVEDLKQYRAVTAEDIMAVYEKYFKNAKKLAVSIVPVGQETLAVDGSLVAQVDQESIEDQQLSSQAGEIVDDPYEFSPSKIDRTKEPEYLANTPMVAAPKVWSSKVGQIEVRGIKYSELPLVNFNITIAPGMLKDPKGKIGTAYLTAALMNKGTQHKTADELMNAIGMLGASIHVSASNENIVIGGNCLVDNFAAVVAIVEEMILHPRWDADAFEIEKNKVLESLKMSSTMPANIASQVMRNSMFGAQNQESNSVMGTPESIEAITLDDLKAFYGQYVSSNAAKLNVVGDLSAEQIEKSIASLSQKWEAKEFEPFTYASSYPDMKGKVLFIDYPDARQSYILIGGHSVGINNKDAYPLTVVNEKLGGSAGALLFKVLRLERGYTYGAYSGFRQGKVGTFYAQSSVQATVTRESLDIFEDILSNYEETFDQEMLSSTIFMLKAQSFSAYETPGALIGILGSISKYGLPDNFIEEREKVLDNFTLEQAKELIDKYIDIDNMTVVVVGDKKSQLSAVKKADIGEVIVVDKDGNKI